MKGVIEYVRRHRPLAVLMGFILILTTIPVVYTCFVLGSSWWAGIPPTFTDEAFYYARVQTVVHGHPTEGNPYFFEHADGAPLVIFGGTWLNALPQLAGLSLNTSLLLNFVLWSLLFAGFLYWLLRELRVPPWISVFGTILVYVQSYVHVWRAVNLQTVYPFYFLFYVLLWRVMKDQNKRNIVMLGLITGLMLYLFSYMWQAIVITLGLLFLYSLVKKDWPLMLATLKSSFIGGIIGLPVPLYALWLSYSSPYFWESVGRLGLINTHLPMAEVLYSGGWVGLVLALLAVLYWKSKDLQNDYEFVAICRFVCISGLGLWIMQGSNAITGKLLETGEHVKLLMYPWLIVVTISVTILLWNRRSVLSSSLRLLSVFVLTTLSVVNIYYTYLYFSPFLTQSTNLEVWQAAQHKEELFTWLSNKEESSVVVWSNPHDDISSNLPIYTKHFTLSTWAGLMELVPEGEIRERYLISEYFNNPTADYLKQMDNMLLYLGRRDLPHQAKTNERGTKLCRIVFFWDKGHDCGVIQTPQELLGDKFFSDLEDKFKNDIKPNIKKYLVKYHVTYILKDKVLDTQYHPETLGAVRVYTDDKYEIWHL